MRVVTKHASACVAIATLPEHQYVYAAAEDGTVHVIGDGGETVVKRFRQPGGIADMAVTMSGYRLVYLTDAGRSVGWRNMKANWPNPSGHNGRTLPPGWEAKGITAVGGDRLHAVAAEGGLIWVCKWGVGVRGSNRAVKEARHQLAADSWVRCLQYVDRAGELLVAGIQRNQRALSGYDYGATSGYSHLTVYHGIPESRIDSRLNALFDVNLGDAPVCVARTENRVVYAGLDQGRLLRLDLRGYRPGCRPPDPNAICIPQAPRVSAIAVSACGRFVAVGADYEDYGAVLLYDADLKPLAMFDTTSAPLTLAFHAPWLPDDPPTPTLFSGHPGGQVIKWYIDRQLSWMSLVAERPSPQPAGSAGAADHTRAIDL